MFAAGLPLSEYFSSQSQFFIGGYWLLSGNFYEKWEILKKRKSILVFLLIYAVHLAALIWTDDFKFASNDLRIKISLLLIPVFVGTMPALTGKQIRTIFNFFLASLAVASFICTAVSLGLTNHVINDSRDISIFISHIRFSLLINMGIVICLFYAFLSDIKIKPTERLIYIIAASWFCIFLFILKSFTGIVIASIIFPICISYILYVKKKKLLVIATAAFFILLAIAIVSYITDIAKELYNIEKTDTTILDTYTQKGNRYTHNVSDKIIENGNYVNIYICEKELEQCWNKVSSIEYSGNDKKGNILKYTLIRYLSSKGLRKDNEGFSQLSKSDISNIENGCANFKFCDDGIRSNIYKILWQTDYYLKGGNPSGHSITQRMEYLKAAVAIFQNNLWIGVGTGDLKKEFEQNYEQSKTLLDINCRHRAHNQLLTFLIAFGIIGFLIISLGLVYPVIKEEAYKSFIFVVFATVFILSMMNEDTLETAPGMAFFIFFYSIFIFGKQNKYYAIEKENA